MVRRYIMMFAALSAGLLSQGCFNSERDYEDLKADLDSMAAELEAANQENRILNQALANIKKEQERLQLMLNAARASAPSPEPPRPNLAGGSTTMNWGGYEWTLPPDSLATRPAGPDPAPPAPPAEPSGRIYQPKAGDVLSSIAARHNTTVERLVELNPYLARRRNYMIHLTDKIVLP